MFVNGLKPLRWCSAIYEKMINCRELWLNDILDTTTIAQKVQMPCKQFSLIHNIIFVRIHHSKLKIISNYKKLHEGIETNKYYVLLLEFLFKSNDTFIQEMISSYAFRDNHVTIIKRFFA